MVNTDGRLLFLKNNKSERVVDSDEIVSIINATTINKATMQRLTGNLIKNSLYDLEKNELVRVKESNMLSKTRPEKFYYSKSFNAKQAVNVDLLSYGVWALRYFKKIGRVNIKENGNGIATILIDESNDEIANVEFVAINFSNYERKLAQLPRDGQYCIVVDGTALSSQLKKEHLKANSFILVIDQIGKNKQINAIYVDQNKKMGRLTGDFDWHVLTTRKSPLLAESIGLNYSRAEELRVNSPF